jgi:hypothetical protein
MKIEGIAASIISEGTPQKNAITLIGKGPRLRIYCLYDEDASTEDANESSLNWNPFESEWEIYLPVEQSDLEWVKTTLSGKGNRFKAYLAGTKIPAEEDTNNAKNSGTSLAIDISKL